MKLHSHKKPALFSVVIGILFGIFDWYFPQIIQVSIFPGYANLVFVYGIWLVPAFIVVFFNLRYTNKPRFIGMNVSMCWLTSILAYYTYYVLLIAIIGVPQLAELQIKNIGAPLFKQSWLFIIRETFIPKIIIWIPFAIVAGYIVGWSSGICYQLITRCWKTNS